MMKASKIAEIMSNRKDDWKEYMAEFYPDINIKEDEHFALFEYKISADFKDPVIREARGIIIDKTTFDVVCWPFNKFSEWDDSAADTIDWSTARIEEKIDGSIIKYWYNPYTNQFQWSTNGMINAGDALANLTDRKSMLDVIKSTDQYEIITNEVLSNDFTYIFELTSLDNQVIIKYNKPTLTLIGMRNNITGDEFNPHISWLTEIVPTTYVYHNVKTLDECIEFIVDREISTRNIKEGFVVVDSNFNRIKIKSEVYLTLQGLKCRVSKYRKTYLKLLYQKRIHVDVACRHLPELTAELKYYDYMLSDTIDYAEKLLLASRKWYKEHDCNKKLLAEKLECEKLNSLVFRGIDNNKTVRDLLDEMNEKGVDGAFKFLAKIIPSYERNEIDFFNE